MSTINILIPVHIPDWWRDLAIERYRKHASNGTRLVGTMPDEGEAVGTTEELARVLTRKGKDMERSAGAGVHILDCFGDPAIEELTRSLDRPVLGVGGTGMAYAHKRFARFAVITSEDQVKDEIRAAAEAYDISARLRAVEAVGLSAAEIPSRREEAMTRLKAKAAPLFGKVDGIVLGCTELAEFAPALEAALRADCGAGLSIVNPIAVAVRWAEMDLVARAAACATP